MPSPVTAPLVGFASKLRYPTLFKLTLALMLVSWLLPDPIPFLDEIATALAALVLANWRRKDTPEAPDTSRPEGRTIEGESRRE